MRYRVINGGEGGGDRRFRKVGLPYEVVGPGADGGPVLVAACPDEGSAERVRGALELAARPEGGKGGCDEEAEALRLHNRDEVRARGNDGGWENASGLGDPREAQGRIPVPAQADRSGYREVDHTGVR